MDVEVYIGDVTDPHFNYESGSWSGNIPKRVSGFFPNPHSIFFSLIEKIEKGEIIGKQTDWGSWTALLYPNELAEVIKELYGNEVCANDNSIRGILDFVNQLDNEQQYGLVACEIG